MRKGRPRLWTDEFYHSVDPETFSIGFHKAELGWISPMKDSVQTDFDVWYVAAGQGHVLVDRQWHPFRTGDLVTIKPGRSYQRERTDPTDPFQIYFMHVLPFGAEDRGLNEMLARVWPLKICLLHRPEFPGLFNRLFEAYATRLTNHSLAVKGLAMQLLHVVFEELQKAPTPGAPRAHLNLLEAKRLIESRYPANLSLKDIADHCGLSPSHLSALFTRHMGAPPVEYLLRVRLREAKLLLARGMRVKEAAHAVGFHSQHYFSRVFKAKTGMSPTQFAVRHARK